MQIMKHINKFRFIFCLSIVAFFMVSCNSDGPEIEQPEKIYYDQAQRRMAAKNFFGAIESLEAVETRYPFGKYAEQAQVELIYANFMNSDNEASHAAAEKFISARRRACRPPSPFHPQSLSNPWPLRHPRARQTAAS